MIIERYVPQIEKPTYSHVAPVPAEAEASVKDWSKSLLDTIPGRVISRGGNYDGGPSDGGVAQVTADCEAFNHQEQAKDPQASCGLQTLPAGGEYFLIEAEGKEFNNGTYNPTTDTITKIDGTQITVTDEIQQFEKQLNGSPPIPDSATNQMAVTPVLSTGSDITPTATSAPITLSEVFAKKVEVQTCPDISPDYAKCIFEYTDQAKGNGLFKIIPTFFEGSPISTFNLSIFLRDLGMTNDEIRDFSDSHGISTPSDPNQDILTSETIELPLVSGVIKVPVLDGNQTTYKNISSNDIEKHVIEGLFINEQTYKSLLVARKEAEASKIWWSNFWADAGGVAKYGGLSVVAIIATIFGIGALKGSSEPTTFAGTLEAYKKQEQREGKKHGEKEMRDAIKARTLSDHLTRLFDRELRKMDKELIKQSGEDEANKRLNI